MKFKIVENKQLNELYRDQYQDPRRIKVSPNATSYVKDIGGQLSDGYWENSPRMEGYWRFFYVDGDDIVIADNWDQYDEYSRRHVIPNLFKRMSDTEIKNFFADKIKFMVKAELKDNNEDPVANWNRNSDYELDYLHGTIADAYKAYDELKGRKVRESIDLDEALGLKEPLNETEEQYPEREITIDCASGTPRPDYYLKEILAGTGIEPVAPAYTAFGEWGFKFNNIPNDKWAKVYDTIWNRLVNLYDKGAIRYASISKKDGELDEALGLKEGYDFDFIADMNREELEKEIDSIYYEAGKNHNSDITAIIEDPTVFNEDDSSDEGYFEGVPTERLRKVLNILLKLKNNQRVSHDELNKLTEDTIKQNGKWVNKGEDGTHGTFKTKKAADAQRKAMYAQGFGENMKESVKEWIYLFPELTDEDKDKLHEYDLIYLGKNYFENEVNDVVKGTQFDLRRYARNYLDYVLHPDYLYYADDFAGEIVSEGLKNDDIHDFLDKARKLGAKTFKDLERLSKEHEFNGILDLDRMNTYYKNANPDDKDLSEDLDISSLEQKIRQEIRKFYKFFDDNDYEEFVNDYLVVEVEDRPKDTKVEVRLEASYNTMDKIADLLNPIVQKLDKDAYFDHEDAGIINAFIRKDKHLDKDHNESEELKEIEVPNYFDTWSSFDSMSVNSKTYYIMENDEWGDETFYLVITPDFEEIYETFDDIETCLRDEGILTDELDENLNESEDEDQYFEKLKPEIEECARRDWEVGHTFDPDDFDEFAHTIIDDEPNLGKFEDGELKLYYSDLLHRLFDYYHECLDEIRSEEYDNKYDEEDDSDLDEKLIRGKSDSTLKKNIATEIEAGKDPKQAYAIAKSIQKKNMKEAKEARVIEIPQSVIDKTNLQIEQSYMPIVKKTTKILWAKTDATQVYEREVYSDHVDYEVRTNSPEHKTKKYRVYEDGRVQELQLSESFDTFNSARFSIYKVITDRDYSETDIKEDELEIKGVSDTFEKAIDILEEIEKQGFEGIIKDNELNEFITKQEISDWYKAKDYADINADFYDESPLTEDDNAEEIIESGKDKWVRTEEDEKVWNSLSDDDKYFLSMSNDMGFWFDEIQGNDDLENRYYQLRSKFSTSNNADDEPYIDYGDDDFNESLQSNRVVKSAKHVIDKLENIGDASLEVDDIGSLKKLRKDIDSLLDSDRKKFDKRLTDIDDEPYVDLDSDDFNFNEELKKASPEKKKEIEAEIDQVEKEIDRADDHNNPQGVIDGQQKLDQLQENIDDEPVVDYVNENLTDKPQQGKDVDLNSIKG